MLAMAELFNQCQKSRKLTVLTLSSPFPTLRPCSKVVLKRTCLLKHISTPELWSPGQDYPQLYAVLLRLARNQTIRPGRVGQGQHSSFSRLYGRLQVYGGSMTYGEGSRFWEGREKVQGAGCCRLFGLHPGNVQLGELCSNALPHRGEQIPRISYGLVDEFKDFLIHGLPIRCLEGTGCWVN